MELNEINKIIADYDNLIKIVESKVVVLEKLDFKYCTARGIDDIFFENDRVCVRCDNSFMGCADTLYFDFPIQWLTKSDDELKQLVIDERDAREKKEREIEERKLLEENKRREQFEHEQYLKLKLKYES